MPYFQITQEYFFPQSPSYTLQLVPHLNPGFWQANLLGEPLPGKNVWVVRPLELCKEKERGMKWDELSGNGDDDHTGDVALSSAIRDGCLAAKSKSGVETVSHRQSSI